MADTTTAHEAQDTAAAAAQENPAMEGSLTYTQEEFETEVKKRVTGAVRERIDRANAKHQKEVDGLTARNSKLQEQVDSLSSELDGCRKKERASAWAEEVSKETGVPASARLTTSQDVTAPKPYMFPPVTARALSSAARRLAPCPPRTAARRSSGTARA